LGLNQQLAGLNEANRCLIFGTLKTSCNTILRYLSAAIFSLLLLASVQCRKDSAAPLGAGILLTVDKPADTWYHLKDFLKENNVKLTFYVEGYQALHDSSRQILKEMMADGHEIAHHTSTHAHGDDFVREHGIDAYMLQEIISMRDSMRRDGFNPVNFAYPFGDCTAELDRNLLLHFNSLRKLLGTYLNKRIADMEQVYFRYGDLRIFYGIGIDVRYKRPLSEVFEALVKAKSSRQTVSLYCHYLSTTGRLEGSDSHIMEEDLKRIVLKARSLGLRFYAVSEVSRHQY
jgi:peptidoglycan/xylan/chitin deacetylase (PgdA/CDA1 family)